MDAYYFGKFIGSIAFGVVAVALLIFVIYRLTRK